LKIKIAGLEQRFWSKVEKTEKCWNWLSSKQSKGYGQFRHGNSMRLAHRVTWELTYGRIPLRLCVLHHCDNPLCVNPSHLFLGTQSDNMHDKFVKDRQNKGETDGFHKLTEKDVGRIREEYVPHHVTRPMLANKYHVHRRTIDSVLDGKTWRHVP
jgi:hypothetical protein